MSVEALLPQKRGHLGEGWQLQQLLHPALGCLFLPGYFINSSQLAGGKWPAGCKMAAVIRWRLLCLKESMMQGSVKRQSNGFGFCAVLFKTYRVMMPWAYWRAWDILTGRFLCGFYCWACSGSVWSVCLVLILPMTELDHRITKMSLPLGWVGRIFIM